jgi:arabinan endo-1,5-alpha-L-arabinosidase
MVEAHRRPGSAEWEARRAAVTVRARRAAFALGLLGIGAWVSGSLFGCGSSAGSGVSAGTSGAAGAGSGTGTGSTGSPAGMSSSSSPSSDAGEGTSGGGTASGSASGEADSATARLPADGSTGSTGGTAGTGSTGSGSSGSGSSAGTDASVLDDAGLARTGDASTKPGSADSGATEGGATACGNLVLGGGPITTTTTHLDIGVHDPSMIWDGTAYFLFATGGTLNVRRSTDMRTWTNAGNLFTTVPAWISTALGQTPTDLWAPDISFFNGQFHVYYAGSTFGSNDSVIGLATTASLASPHFADQGMVVQSTTADTFNAIDPNVSFDQDCTPWLAFGSFWTGIKLRKLDAATGKPATSDPTTYSLASRGSGGAIEAASIVSHNGYYYLFVSFDCAAKG